MVPKPFTIYAQLVDFEEDKIIISTNLSSAKISLRSNFIMLNLIFISDLIDILNLGRVGGDSVHYFLTTNLIIPDVF